MNTETILTFRDVYKTYKKGEKQVETLKNLSFSTKKSTITLITGPSGAGKTTLIYLAGLLKKPTMGEIYIKGRKTSNLNDRERSRIIRNEIGFLFRRLNLIPNLSALENVMLPMISPDAGKAKKLLKKVGIEDINSFPAEMTFEEEQRVTLARAMATNPSLILADEPTGELNSDSSKKFMALLQSLKGYTVLMVSDNILFSKFAYETFN
ncbi:MAG: ATP-binding cassette domain-containing protein, partial [Methanobacterium sp.]